MTATPDRHDGESFRVSHHGYWIGYARSVAELERWIAGRRVACRPAPCRRPQWQWGRGGAAHAAVAALASVSGNAALGQQMAAGYGWTGGQWGCLSALWARESG
jgi:hypothetical protein